MIYVCEQMDRAVTKVCANCDCGMVIPATTPTPESELVARLRFVAGATHFDVQRGYVDPEVPALFNQAAATIERLHSELRLCRAALLAERMCADILEDGAEERPHSAHEQGRREGIEMAAKVCDERAAKSWRPVAKDEATECADAIRALYVGRTE